MWVKYLLLYCCICDSNKFDMQNSHVLKKVNFELLTPISGSGDRGRRFSAIVF